jgi:hypothetical protein
MRAGLAAWIIILIEAIALAGAPASVLLAQTSGRSFEPGELIVGYKSPDDREHALRQLNSAVVSLHVRGEPVENLQVQPVGLSAVKLRFNLPDKVQATTAKDSGTELQVLQDLAAQIKNDDDRVKYAHPNWILDQLSGGPRKDLR